MRCVPIRSSTSRWCPVGMYWGRAPQKERSLIRLMLSEDWAFGSRLRRGFSVLVNGRNVWVQLGDPISLRSLLGGEADTASAARRVTRALRVQLARARAARIGPDLSHRRTIVAEVLRSRAVRQAVAQTRAREARAPAGATRCSRRAAASMRSPPTTRTAS